MGILQHNVPNRRSSFCIYQTKYTLVNRMLAFKPDFSILNGSAIQIIWNTTSISFQIQNLMI